ncbi:MAG TPA: EpsI family protein [Caulobacteraceae bacterium]|nr:EpsI family protein [Caulobacteraceae bacterium]
MIGRRDLLISGACLAAAGAAYGLQPRRRVSLLGSAKLTDIVPATFRGWTSKDVGDLVAPRDEGSLEARLYEQTVGRIYQPQAGGDEILMFMAHGDTQSNLLQLHRPEVCYPAFGYVISDNHPVLVPLAKDADLPARRLVADAPDRREHLVYWTRLGEYLPVGAHEQRYDRLRTAMAGYVADGLLARFSVMGADPARAFAEVEGFIRALVIAVEPRWRASLIGTGLSQDLSRDGV